jgi:hypothetical protein
MKKKTIEKILVPIEPLERSAEWQAGEVEETSPSGL